jgi:hypothetical protein
VDGSSGFRKNFVIAFDEHGTATLPVKNYISFPVRLGFTPDVSVREVAAEGRRFCNSAKRMPEEPVKCEGSSS